MSLEREVLPDQSSTGTPACVQDRGNHACVARVRASVDDFYEQEFVKICYELTHKGSVKSFSSLARKRV